MDIPRRSALFYLKGNREEIHLGKVGVLGGVDGRETTVRMQCMRDEYKLKKLF